MALQLGIQLASSQTNNYLTDAKYVRGGYLIVEDITTIDERWYDTGDGGVIVEGSLCYDLATSKFYKYTGSGLASGWEELEFSTAVDDKTITLNGDGELSIYGFGSATNNQVPAKDINTGKIKWTDISGLIPGAVVPVTDLETINVTQDPTDNTKYVISIKGKETAVDKSVLRKHITGSGSSQVVTYTWDEIYSASEVDSLLSAKQNALTGENGITVTSDNKVKLVDDLILNGGSASDWAS